MGRFIGINEALEPGFAMDVVIDHWEWRCLVGDVAAQGLADENTRTFKHFDDPCL